jgi:hypothetical protein
MSEPLPASRSDSPGGGAALRPLWRAPLLVLGFAALIVGVGAGLAQLGWSVPAVAASAASQHGALMICGFFGVVISLERAVAIGRHWAYCGPVLAGLGAAAAIAGIGALAPWLFLAASIVLLAASADVVRRQTTLFNIIVALGALCWSAGNALWAAGSSVSEVVPWWLAFPILTIAGERLELSRFLPPSPVAKRMFEGIIAVVGVGLLAAHLPWGAAVFGAGLLALSAWLLKQDIARRTVRGRGLTRFIAVCLLSGYVWLAVGGGIIFAVAAFVPGSPSYDAALHALLLGFVFSMVFGHAPIIFPAVLRVEIPYHPVFYLPLALLHASLLVRLFGDAAGRFEWTRAGGMLNALALAAFIAVTAGAVVRGRRTARRTAVRSATD